MKVTSVARRLGLLPQGPVAPGGITVVDLVARGRHPHQGALRVIALRHGRIVAQGPLSDSVTAERVEEAGGLRCQVISDPCTGKPLVIPAARPAVSVGCSPT